MIASLVVVLPTKHAGGALLFRHAGLEYEVDSAKLIGEATTPTIAYAAFYSDVEHEVLPVASGHRVTITYNLFFTGSPGSAAKAPATATEPILAAFCTLLADATFMPEGGTLGFGLAHQYSVPVPTEAEHRDYYDDDDEAERSEAEEEEEETAFEGDENKV